MAPMYDEATGELSSATFAVDDHSVTKDQGSILDTLSGIATKGVPLTGLAIVNSFANTAIEASNFVTGSSYDKISIQDEVGEGSLNDYYNEHSQGIEAAALTIGSLAPGLGAIKGASVAIKAAFLAKEGLGSEALASATGLLSPLKAKVVQGAVDEIKLGTAALFPSMALEKTTAIAQYSKLGLGVADNALQGMVFTAATAATMHASPLLDDQTFGDAVNDTIMGGVVGGLVGGLLEGVGTRGLFNKAMMNASNSAKPYEAQARLGIGDYTAGDHIATILDGMVDIPIGAETTALQSKTASISLDTAKLQVRKTINSSLIDKGEEDVGNAFADSLLDAREAGQSREDMFEKTARLVKVDRFTGPDDLLSAAPSSNEFFINKFARKDTPPTWNSLVSSTQDPAAQLSNKYALREGSTTVNIAHFADMFTGPAGESVRNFPTVASAWEAGQDMYIDSRLQVHVNPASENIEGRIPLGGMNRTLTSKEGAVYKRTGALPTDSTRELTGAPVILNVKTGAQTLGGTQAVVGDLGKISLLENGSILKAGDKLLPVSSPLSSETPTLQANARYVATSLRGIKYGDVIIKTDLPMMEQLYREGTKEGSDFAAAMKNLTENKSVTFSDGSPLPSTAADLLSAINTEKQSLATELLNKNPNMGSDEIALRINSPEEYITNGMKGKDFSDISIPPEDHMEVNHVKLSYDIGSPSSADGNIQRGALDVAYRIQLAREASNDALADYFGPHWDQFISEGKSTDASVLGIGGGYVSSVNSDYGTLGQSLQRIGRIVTEQGRKAMQAVSNVLTPSVNAIREDQTAAAELGIFRTVRLNSNQHYTFLPPELAAKYNMSLDAAVLTKALKRDKNGNILDWDKSYIPKDFFPGQNFTDEPITTNYKPASWYNLSPKVAAFERAQLQVNDARLISRNNFLIAQGLEPKHELGNLYTPNIDTSKYQHFAYVKNIAGRMMSDDGTAVIVAKSKEELQNKIAAIGPDFSVFTKDNLADFHKAAGDYEFSRNFAQSSVNSALERKGILNNILPDTRADSIISDYVNWNSKQEISLIRDHVELGNAQLFAELRAMGERFQDVGSSITGKVDNFTRRTTFNPYDSYIKAALGVPQKDTSYPLWAYANEKIEAFGSTAFKVAKNAFIAANKGMIPYEEAAKMSQKFGLGNPYEATIDGLKAYTDIANQLPDGRTVSQFVSKANAIMGAAVIRLDFWQQLVHITSSPMLMLAEASSALSGKGYPELQKLLSTPLPDGSGRSIPAVSKVLFNSVNNFFNDDIKKQWLPIYKELGIIRDPRVIDEQFQAMNNLAFPTSSGMWAKAGENLKKASDWTAKYVTQSDNSNALLHFMAADMGRQIFEAAGYEGKQLTDNIGTFSSRIFGNFVASQRPVAFQGPIGQAVGLFQSYYFNFMQQAFRYVENGDAKSLAILGGMQSTIFGLQGTPGFSFINNHIVGNASGNSGHGDIYSAVASFTGDRDVNNFVMYGALSSLTGAGLYTRGDLSPRSLTIVPVNPMDWPSVRGAVNFTSSLIDTEEKIRAGGNIPASLLIGLEHNGLSRPLKGIAQMLQGYSTTAEGSLISTVPGVRNNTQGMSELFSIANFSRLLSARPLDEAVAMDANYRYNLYKAKDTARMEALGEAVKSTMYNNQDPSEEQISNFATEYARSGGEITHFNRSLMSWSQKANTSVANKVFNSLRNSKSAKNAMMIMGGTPLPDFMGSGSTLGSTALQPTTENDNEE